MTHFYRTFIVPINYVVLAYFVALGLFYLVLYISAALEMRRYLREVRAEKYREILSSEIAPSISMLVPAHNEETSIQESVRALLTLAYPQLEIVVVDDGSTDNTLGVLISTFDLLQIKPIYDQQIATKPVEAIFRSRQFPNLVVVSKNKGGKADSLNAGLNISGSELVCAIDADTILDPDGLRRLVRPFIRSRDVVAAGATIRVANGCTVMQGRLASERGPHRALAGIQAVEYLRAFLFGRPGWNRLGGNLLISGAFGLFRRQSLLETNGYVKTVGEDMELVVRLRRHAYDTGQPARIEFVPDPVAWTETPTSFKELGRQRERWQRGFTDVLWRHRRVLFNRRYGLLGMVVFPAFVLFEWMAPIIEAVGLVVVTVGLILGQVSAQFAILFFSLACGVGILLSMLALMLEELSFRRYGRARDRALLVVWAVLENLGYRQLTVWWRLRGVASYLRRKKSWGKMTRKGFNPAEEADASFGEGDSLAAWARSKRAAAAGTMPSDATVAPGAGELRESGATAGRSLQEVR
jgi:cellulose synthase/poly-beta-1,6-N-acetylglucosamine synthase-like glycosyltransferase